MKKLVLAFGVMFLLIGVVANASEVRLTTLGENHAVMKDDANIWLFPSTIVSYPDMAIGEIYYGDFGNMGMHWRLGEWTMAGYFNNYTHYMPLAGASIDQRIDFFLGRELSEMAVGGRLSYWSEGEKVENSPQRWNGITAENYDEAYSRLEIALGATAMEGKLDVALTVGFSSWNREDNFVDPIGLAGAPADTSFAPYDEATSDGDMDFDFIARYFYERTDQWTLVPHLSFTKGKEGRIDQGWYGVDENGDLADDLYALYQSGESEYKYSDISIGVGTNFQASEDVMTVSDVGINLRSSSREYLYFTAPDYIDPADPALVGTKTARNLYEDTWHVVPYFKVGLDAAVRDWLDLRMGAVSEWNSHENTRESNNYNDTIPTRSRTRYGVLTRTYLGAGFHWGDMEIDALLEPAFLNNGPEFITGAETSDWAGMVALIYNFGK